MTPGSSRSNTHTNREFRSMEVVYRVVVFALLIVQFSLLVGLILVLLMS